jgi:hypothetical protein
LIGNKMYSFMFAGWEDFTAGTCPRRTVSS